jgi:GNAT superfamily N-acetyltransferase
VSWFAVLKIKPKFTLTHKFGEEGGQKIIEIEAGEYGKGSFFITKDALIPLRVNVDRDFRQQGIGTDIYDYAEKITGLTVKNKSSIQTEDAEKFWAKRTGEKNIPTMWAVGTGTGEYTWEEEEE